MSEFAGKVYDGPWEGRNHHHEYPCFEINVIPHGQFILTDPVPPSAHFYRCAYRWSYPLRAWVFVWTTAPPEWNAPPKKRRHR